ncbi:expressed unknown protein [Seminavis robusta]|uniref:Uncharacterized protein n=1 Tax=Seminavis robusta TaxID=568900 RepID=A0A9N8EK21_9STRA|nr:expressed unknown protein [Seminavis robusta]|eukprot:Sro1203_g252060.1 n/a (438) ;mRNA; r:8929-10428
MGESFLLSRSTAGDQLHPTGTSEPLSILSVALGQAKPAAVAVLCAVRNTQDPQKNEVKSLSTFRKAKQERRQPTERRDRFYWQDLRNVESEFQNFWISLGIKTKRKSAICIPNETILRYFGRHDLRWAIATHGGRDELFFKMKNVVEMPGKWNEAVESCPEMQRLLKNQTIGLSARGPPKLEGTGEGAEKEEASRKWMHRSGRKPLGYWSQQQVLVDLYEYLHEQHAKLERPAIWMSRPSEIAEEGRGDLSQAISRFGGAKKITKLAGLVPFREWHFFEGQYELFLLLKEYIDDYYMYSQDFQGDDNSSGTSRYQSFPSVNPMRFNGHERLHYLIQYYGGRKFLSGRLGMTGGQNGVESWGNFSLEFAIRLCEFIRSDHKRAKPPVRNPVISIPSERRLSQAGSEGAWLHDRIVEYGGYENVARRLYLAYTFNRRMG